MRVYLRRGCILSLVGHQVFIEAHVTGREGTPDTRQCVSCSISSSPIPTTYAHLLTLRDGNSDRDVGELSSRGRDWNFMQHHASCNTIDQLRLYLAVWFFLNSPCFLNFVSTLLYPMLRVYQLSTAFPLAQYIHVGYKILLSFLMYIIVETIRIERRMFFFFVLCDMKIVICFLIFNIFLLYKFKYEIV